jgi:hypothetical protein
VSSGIDRILDRARKLSALAQHSDNEAEAALAASRLRQIMEEHALSEAMLRLDDVDAKPEPILRNARLEPDAPKTGRKRVAWKETISASVAKDLGVHEFYRYATYWSGNTMRRCADIRGVGRETAIQTWQYTCQYLWRAIDELADAAWSRQGGSDSMGETRAWKNSFRSGCASTIAERIYANRRRERDVAEATREAVINASTGATRESLALSIVERDQTEVDDMYEQIRKGFTSRGAASIGATSGDGYGAGRAAGRSVSLGTRRAALGAGQGRLKKGGKP